MKNKNTKIYEYRYIWLTIEKKCCVKYIVGTEAEHSAFMAKLKESSEVEKASRSYISEIDVSMTEQHEIVKGEKK